jgi:predicted RecB family nuclease
MRSQCNHCSRLSMAREFDVPGVKELTQEFYVAPDNLAIRYGIRFETRLEQELLANLGTEDVQAPKTNSPSETLDLMSHGVPIIYQGSLYGGSGKYPFSGRPDFLVRADYQLHFSSEGLTTLRAVGNQKTYTAWDAKLSAVAKPEYQNQVALYADVLKTYGMASNTHHGLILGNRELVGFSKDVLFAQLEPARAKLFAQMAVFESEIPATVDYLGPLHCDLSSYCQICEYPQLCDHARRQVSSLQLVAGITGGQIQSLHDVGVKTVSDLAKFTGETEKLTAQQVAKLSTQARLQADQYLTGQPSFEVIAPEELNVLPDPNPGDIFFDLEGFSFFDQPGGLEYLFGYVADLGDEFFHHWADTRTEEKHAFEQFMTEVLRRQKEFPGARIYHYANYEQAALKRMAARYSSFEAEVQDLIDKGVFIDLYKVVKASLMISQESYSIKKLETYYDFKRSADVKEAMGSMEYYDQYLELAADNYPEAEKLKRQVITYNQEDCVSTLALYRWLKSLS